jgi:ABC-type Mn2+/Zn2+ transport system permease subunit
MPEKSAAADQRLRSEMSDGAVGIILLVVITVIVSALIHRWTTRFWTGCLVATVISVVGFQLVAYAHNGHLDPFVLIAIPVSGLLSFLVSILVGKVIESMRRRKQTDEGI